MQGKTSYSSLDEHDCQTPDVQENWAMGHLVKTKVIRWRYIYFMCTFTNLEQIFTKLSQNIIYDKSPKRGLAYCMGLHLGWGWGEGGDIAE